MSFTDVPTTDLASRRSVTSKGSKISSAGASTKSKAPKACEGHRLAGSFDPRCDVRRGSRKSSGSASRVKKSKAADASTAFGVDAQASTMAAGCHAGDRKSVV